MRGRCSRSTTPSTRRTSAISSPASAASSACRRTRRSSSSPSRRSTASRRRCATRTAVRAGRHPRRRHRRRGRHRQSAHASTDVPPKRLQGKHIPDGARGARRGLYAPRRFPEAERGARQGRRAGLRQSAQLRRRHACARSIPKITAARPLRFFAYAWGEVSEPVAKTHWEFLAAPPGLGLPVNPLAQAAASRSTRRWRFYRRDRRAAAPRCPTTSTASSTR